MNNETFNQSNFQSSEKSSINLGEIGVFVSGFLLSIGGCIAIVASSIRRSRCVSINCFCLKCLRNPVIDVEPSV
ncbi:MAG: hypothetical protein ACI9YE_000452 [Psychroserpens sp.]|jgi:hypothetical protein